MPIANHPNVPRKPILDLESLDLSGNEGGKIKPESLGWLNALPASASDEEIRGALARDGVVHIKGLLNREKVLDTRADYFEFVSPSGVLKEGTTPRQGIFRGGDPDDFSGPGVHPKGGDKDPFGYLRLSVEAGMSEFINQFGKDEEIMNMVKRIQPTWEEPILFKRQLLRSNIPGSEKSCTKVHYDQLFLRAAPATSLTAWIPLGDISPLGGGLLYLENSVPLGTEIEAEFQRTNGNLTLEERLSAFNTNMEHKGFLSTDTKLFGEEQGRRWLVGDFEAGDAVFHHPNMIHCSSNNTDPEGRIRLATDLRFGDRKGEYDRRWAENYCESCGRGNGGRGKGLMKGVISRTGGWALV